MYYCSLQWSTFLNFDSPLKEPHLVALGHKFELLLYEFR